MDRLPVRSGIYFPIVAILSPRGDVYDRWLLDRAILIEEEAGGFLPAEFGPVHFTGTWESVGISPTKSEADLNAS